MLKTYIFNTQIKGTLVSHIVAESEEAARQFLADNMPVEVYDDLEGTFISNIDVQSNDELMFVEG